MSIVAIKARKIMACPGAFAWLAEAEVMEDGKTVYVLVQYYDGEEYTVRANSLYGYLAEDGAEPDGEFLEEHTSWKEAKESAYAGVFEKLRKVIKMLG